MAKESGYSVHIIYPYSAEVGGIFLQKVQKVQHQAEREGRTMGNPQHYDVPFMELLKSMGFTFKTIKRTYLTGRNQVNGVRIEVSKIKKGTRIKELLIRIPASTFPEATERMGLVRDFVEKTAGIRGEENLWNRVVC